MKTTCCSIARRLSALFVLMLAAAVQPLSAQVTLADAHAALAAKDFQLLKTKTDSLITSDATNQEAHVLRAIALMGLAVENDVPTFLKSKMGATSAVIDLSADTANVDIPSVFVYDTGATWTQSGSTYTLSKAYNFDQDNKPLICFENRGTDDYVMTLQLDAPPDSNAYFSGSLVVDGQWSAWIDVSQSGYLYGEFYNNFNGTVDPDAMTLTFTIPAGTNVTFEVGENSAGVHFTIVGTKPATVVVLNGKGSYDSHPKFPSGANLTSLFAFAAQEDTSVLDPMLADLAAVTSTDFTMTLPASETGHPEDVIVQYADVQLTMALLKINKGLRLLSTSYNMSFDLSGGLFFEATSPVTVMTKNASFLTAVTTASAASRTQAKALLDAAAQHCLNADNAGANSLFSRPVPAAAAYLFTIDTEDTSDLPERHAAFLDGVNLIRDALAGPVSLASVFADLATTESLPDTATFSLAPLFAATPLNVRGLFPTFTQNGIQAGTSMKLLGSGLFNGVSGEKWDDYMDIQGLIDTSVAAAKTAPIITAQPQGATVLAGASQTFTVQAYSYPAPTYQWKKNGAVINGATGASYTINPVAGADAGSYTVAVSNGTTTVTSAIAKLVVGFAPVITTQPASKNVKTSTAVSFTVVATGNPLPTYQWKKNGVAITGATKNLYSCTASDATAGTYTVDVINNLDTVTSDAAVLTVGFPPVITTKPVATQTVTAGQSATVSVVASGSDPKTYQWKKNNVAINGATGASYVMDPVAGADAGSYTVTVTNAYGTVTSTIGKLIVIYAPVIVKQPVAQDVKKGLTAKFTVVATGNPLPKYQWRFNGTPITGATLASYSVAASEAKAGSYDVVVTNSVDSVTSDAAVLTVGLPPVITTKPVATQTVTAGQSATVSVVASGSDPKTYQWKKNNVAINGATGASYDMNPVAAGDAGSYTVTVTNAYGTVTSTIGKLAVKYAPTITTQPVSVNVKVGAAVKFTVVATGNPLPTYQWFLNGNLITGATKNIYSTMASVLRTGTYTVKVTNSVDFVVSDPVTLSITSTPPPSGGISAIPAPSVWEGIESIVAPSS